MITKQWLDEIEARANAATPGPWVPQDLSDREAFNSDDNQGWWWVWQESRLPNYGGVLNVSDMSEPRGAIGEATITDQRSGAQERADAEFISNARQDLPELVAMARALLELREHYEQQVEDELPDDNGFWPKAKPVPAGLIWRQLGRVLEGKGRQAGGES